MSPADESAPKKLRVFVSSAQKEMEHERVAVASLITTDPFLLQHCEPVLFEQEPASAKPAKQPYLKCLASCQVYLLLLFKEYGRRDGALSATHHEYRRAQKLELPTLIFIKGDNSVDADRSVEVRAFFDEIHHDRHTYKRFVDREDLKPEVRKGLLRLLKEPFRIEPTAAEEAGGREQIEAASPFEATPLPGVEAAKLDPEMVGRFAEKLGLRLSGKKLGEPALAALHSRGLLWRKSAGTSYCATAAGQILLGPRPANGFPQCEILADAYVGPVVTGHPRGQLNFNEPLPRAIEEVLQFVDRHTFHPTRVVGISNVTLDEYPTRALREAIVNAVAHRDYTDASRKITVQIFSDRVVISSPGFPPAPLTLAKLRRGSYRSCSRNPVIAQALATLRLMEQRGSGFARMHEAMLAHGLAAPAYTEQDGYFVVTFHGPNGDYTRLKTPADAPGMIPTAIETQLSDRQRKMIVRMGEGAALTSRDCQELFDISAQAVHDDFKKLVALGLVTRVGAGRSTRYVLPARG